jgi:hypothetical protein
MATFDVAGSLGFGKSFDALQDGTSDLQMLGKILTEN